MNKTWKVTGTKWNCGNDIVHTVEKGKNKVVYRRSSYHTHVIIERLNDKTLDNTTYTFSGKTESEIWSNFETYLDQLVFGGGG